MLKLQIKYDLIKEGKILSWQLTFAMVAFSTGIQGY